MNEENPDLSKKQGSWLQPLTNEKFIHGFLWALYFFVTAYSRRDPGLTMDQVIFALNYMVMVILVNYVFLPQFLYRKKYLGFMGATLAALTITMLIEETILEPIYFPERGAYFNPFDGLIEIGSILIFFLGFRLLWDHQVNLQRIDQLQKEKVKSQLDFLKSQIDPHFLFNNLNNLYSYALKGSPETPGMILELSDIMRYVLYESQESFVSLSKELKQIQNYVSLQRTQLKGRGNIELKTEGEVKGFRIAPLILFPFIENSFKHSHDSQLDEIVIKINLSIHDGKLRFACSNPYSEIGKENTTSSGIGLKNVRERLELLYPDKYQLDINKAGGFYEVSLELELI